MAKAKSRIKPKKKATKQPAAQAKAKSKPKLVARIKAKFISKAKSKPKPKAKPKPKPKAQIKAKPKALVAKKAAPTKKAAPVKKAAPAKKAAKAAPKKKGGKRVVLRGGIPECSFTGCDEDRTTGVYCRLHYLVSWKKIKKKERLLAEKRLNKYIEELTARYPDEYLDIIRRDLATEKSFADLMEDLDIEALGDSGAEDEEVTGKIKLDEDF